MEDKKISEVPETSTTHNGVLRLVVDKAFHTHTSGIESCRHWKRNNGGIAIVDSSDLIPDQNLIGDHFLNDLMAEKSVKRIGTAFAIGTQKRFRNKTAKRQSDGGASSSSPKFNKKER